MQKITMRSVLLAAGLVLGSTALNAQGVETLEGQVYLPAQIVDGGKYVIRNVADADAWRGWAVEVDNTVRIDVANKNNPATSLTGSGYVFTAHAVEGQSATYHFEAESGNYIHFNGNSTAVTTTAAATDITVALKTAGTPNGVFNLKVPESYLNVNAPSDDAYGTCVGWSDEGDVNGKWEIYAVNGTALDAATLNGDGSYTYVIKNGYGRLTNNNPSSSFYNQYVMGDPQLTLAVPVNNIGVAADGNLNLYSTETYTLSVPAGWKIVSYSFTFQKAGDADVTVTPAGMDGQTSTGDPVSINVENVNAASTTFVVSANGTKPATFSAFKVVIAEVEPFVADVHKLYRVYNARAVEYLSTAQVTTADGAVTGNILTAEDGNDFSFLWKLEGDAENGYKLKNLNADGYYVAGSGAATVGDVAGASVMEIGEGTSNANVTLKVTNNESLGANVYLNAHHCDDSNKGNPNSHAIGTWTNGATDEGNLWEFSEVTELPLAVSAAGYATVNYPVAVRLHEDVTAYGVTDENDTEIVLGELELTDGVLPAGTPVLVAAAEGTYTLTLLPDNSDDALSTGFDGTTLSEVIGEDVNAYILSKKEGDENVKFYQLAANDGDDTTNRTLGINKAYYVADGAAGAALTMRFGGTTTGIDSAVVADKAEADVYYDLSGRRVFYPTRGIYVKADGSKVILK